jgi:uncharacterized membrane protein required for colicin V production
MTALDVFVFLLLIGGAAVGFVRGFVHEVISILAWLVGIAMLKLFHSQLWSGLENSFHTSPAAGAVLAFALLFVPSFVLVKLLARSLGGRTRRHAVLGPFDRTLGGGFGLLKGLLGQTAGAVAVGVAFHLAGVRITPSLLFAASIAAVVAAAISLTRMGVAPPSRVAVYRPILD